VRGRGPDLDWPWWPSRATQKFYQALDNQPLTGFQPMLYQVRSWTVTAFLGFPFAPIEIERRALVTDFLARHPQPCLTTVRLRWASGRRFFHYTTPSPNRDTLLLYARVDPDPQPRLLQPLDRFPRPCRKPYSPAPSNCPHRWSSNRSAAEFLARHPAFAAHFHVVANRDSANYVYRTEDLAALAGSRYAKKRNLVQQATRSTPGGSSRSARKHSKGIVSKSATTSQAKRTTLTLQQESQALTTAIRDFAALGLRGTAPAH